MSTVAKINMCRSQYRDLQSLCGANTTASQEDCTHYIKHSFLKQCMWFRKDINGACDNWWAQNKQEMPAGIIALLKEK